MRRHYEWRLNESLPVLGKHSVAKHDIFEQYVKIYIERLTRTPSQTMLNLTIVDGFSGGGLYRMGTAEVDGSPLRLLAAVEAAEAMLKVSRSKGFTVKSDFFFVDQNFQHIAFLKDILIKRGYGSRIGQDIFIICSSFEEACPEIIKCVQKKGTAQRALFFLDQYGWSDVRFATIRDILRNLKNPEILLTFAVDSLIDFLSEKTTETQALLNVELTREDVRELIGLRSGDGWRYLIQNGLYRHVQTRTGARFYTPFFIHSVEAHRSYWLVHLSNHRQARDEMGKLHWSLNNRFQHHSRAGFYALGFDPSCDLRQGLMTFMFDDDALRRSEAEILNQLPKMIYAEKQNCEGLVFEKLFSDNCNDTPVTSDILSRQLALLRDEGEILIIGENGMQKPRAKTIGWSDRLILPGQRSLFSRLGW